ncbi:MAG TPA: hypothetical protein VND93_33790 [Myxococcales bacterium]|nr:hypothetical protein [Myxococcales bacterium]
MIGQMVSLLVLLAEPGGPPPVPEALLQKMAACDARLKHLYREGAVTMSSRVEELDKAGKVEHSQEVVHRLSRKEGKPHADVVRATRDGKDVTEAERQQAEQADRDERSGGKKAELTTPFAAEVQQSYAFHLLGPNARDPRFQRLAFAPRGKPSRDLWVGEAVVDPETGAVRWMKQRPSELPAFVDRMEMVLEFHAATPEGYAVSDLTMEGEGGLPLFKKRFRVVSKFSDYQAPPPAPGK